MKKLALFTLVCLGLAACEVSTLPRFESMSTEELAAYNQDRPVAQMIVCGENPRTFSRVRRRSCMTVEAMYGSVAQAAQLGVLTALPGYGSAE